MPAPYTAEELLTALILATEPIKRQEWILVENVDEVQAKGLANRLRWEVDRNKDVHLWLAPIASATPSDAEPNQIRRTILKQVYAVYFKDPSASVDRETLAALTSTDIVTLLPHVKLLELEGWVKCRYLYGGDYLTQITASGIRLVENVAEFQQVFPVDGESKEA